MGFFGDLKDFFGSTASWVVDVGGDILTAAADLENMTVSIAGEVWDAIPGELLAPGLGPLAGLLKNETEDELFMMLGPQGLVVGLGVFPVSVDQAAQEIIGGLALVGAIKHRKLNDEEWAMAHWVFGGQLPPRGNIRLTNLGVPKDFWDRGFNKDRAITFPAIANQYYINLGPAYRHKSSIKNAPLLLHELTHVWQGRNKMIRDIQILVAAKDREYEYALGKQWRNYGLEQQGEIVEDWAQGTVENGDAHAAGPISLGSPLFRYVRANLRRNDNGADSRRGSSVRALTGQATGELRLSRVNPPAPTVWWDSSRPPSTAPPPPPPAPSGPHGPSGPRPPGTEEP